MRLTNTIREAFISAAMNDVPSVDYAEQARELAHAELKRQFSRAFPDIDMALAIESGWLNKTGVHMPGTLANLYTYTRGYDALQEDHRLWLRLEALAEKHESQSRQREELRRKLHAVAYSVTTRKALVDALPEFEKYLPADEAKALRSLPVVANVVTDFVRAGWPKGGKAVAA